MKTILLALSLFVSTSASAAWYAEASSSTAMGWGKAYTKQEATVIAMNNCRVRSYAWDVCYIVTLTWVL